MGSTGVELRKAAEKIIDEHTRRCLFDRNPSELLAEITDLLDEAGRRLEAHEVVCKDD